MKKIAFITPREGEYGFRLSGIGQIVVDALTEKIVKDAMDSAEGGLVIIDERLVTNGVGEEWLREMENAWAGVLLVLPSPKKPVEAEDYAARLIRRAIGYHVRLKV